MVSGFGVVLITLAIAISSSIKDSPTSIKDSLTSIKDSLTSIKDSPTSIKDSRTSIKDSPTSIKDLLTSIKDSRTSIKDSRTSIKDSLMSIKDSPTSTATAITPHRFSTIVTHRWNESDRQATLSLFTVASEVSTTGMFNPDARIRQIKPSMYP